MIDQEEWRDIEGYEGLYQISNLGRCKSLARMDSNKHPVREKILGLYSTKDYYRYTLCSGNGAKKTFMAHVLVARLFINNPENKPEVNHKDGNKLNNIWTNLEWVTRSENAIHAFANGLIKHGKSFLGRRGSLHPNSKKVIQLSMDRTPIQTWDSLCLAAYGTGLSQSNITAVCKGRRNHTGGYIWEFKND